MWCGWCNRAFWLVFNSLQYALKTSQSQADTLYGNPPGVLNSAYCMISGLGRGHTKIHATLHPNFLKHQGVSFSNRKWLYDVSRRQFGPQTLSTSDCKKYRCESLIADCGGVANSEVKDFYRVSQNGLSAFEISQHSMANSTVCR